MTRLELIARDLAAVLSPEGEGDWRRFTGMAEDVGTQLHAQLAVAFPATRSRPHGTGPSAAIGL
jgi:hypothetical protein